jgi:subfamily B ATP-binding cassette protein MsbA
MGLFLYATTAIKSIIKYLTFLSINLQTQTASKKIRDVVFGRYLSFGKLFFDNTKTSDLNRLILDSSSTINRILDSINKIIIESITIIVYLVFLMFISWKLTLLSLPLLAILYFVSSSIKHKLKELSKERDEVQKGFLNKISEILSCLILVRGFGKEEKEEQAFKLESDKEIQSNIAIQKKMQIIPPLEEVLSTTTGLIIAGAIALASIYDPNLAMVNAVVFIYILMRIPGEINAVQGAQTNLIQVQGRLEELENVLDDKEKFIFNGGNTKFTGLKSGIEIKNLKFGYVDDRLVLNDVSFEIKKGEKVVDPGLVKLVAILEDN